MSNTEVQESLEAIAIIGMAGRFPGAKNLEEFWQNLRDGVESVSFFPEEELLASGIERSLLDTPNYVKAGAVLEDIDLFDASFFDFNPKEAEITDPQHRLFLECAWEALENAGYDSQKYEGRTGVYGGASLNNYYSFAPNRARLGSAQSYQTLIGNDKDFLTTRVSYKLNLTGPSITVQTACSTSLVAIVLACQSLLNYQCDLALAGGVSIRIPQKTGYFHEPGGTLSSDGHCCAFDAKAEGIIIGNGVGVVVLKRLSEAIADGDFIHAVIKGAAINNDGSGKVGYTAPSINGQAEVIAEAMMLAAVEPETIDYIQAHGTGTVLGDPIEIAALTKVFRANTDKKGFCAIGSVKTNIGHLDAAAGVAGLIQTVLALKHKSIPPSLNFEQPNPEIDFANSPFYVNTKLREWQAGITPRRAGVSSLGIGGTNAHVVLEEAPLESPKSKGKSQKQLWQLLIVSAKTESALETATDNLVEHFKKHLELDLADVAYTLQVGRKEFNYRRIVVGKDLEDVAIALQAREPQRVLTHVTQQKRHSIGFMFPGQGSQYINMGKELYETEPVFRQWIDRCCQLLEPELDLRSLIYPEDSELTTATDKLKQTQIAQPAIFVIEYALAQLWISWGIKPQAAIGHSIGEYVAATIAGVMSLEDALRLVALRGRVMQQMHTGSMLAVSLPEAEVRKLLNDELSIAAINAPSLCVISGSNEAIEKIYPQLTEKNIECRHLHTSHAFHSAMIDSAIAPFHQEVAKVQLNPPQMPFISCVTGTWITAEEATNPHYWAKHMRQTVRFAAGVSKLLKDDNCILLEVGAGRTLSTFVKRNSAGATGQIVLSSLPHPKEKLSDTAFILNILGRLWLAGVEIDWCNFSAHQKRRRVPLPTYPFQRQRYWIDPIDPPSISFYKGEQGKRANISDWFYVPSWKAVPLVNTTNTDRERYLVFVNNSRIGEQIVTKLRHDGKEAIAVYSGDKFSQQNDRTYTINPTISEDYHTLLDAIDRSGNIPTKIIHLWSITPLNKGGSGGSSSFWSLIYLAQALERQQLQNKIQIIVSTNNLYDIIGNETLSYEQATILGVIKVIPQEYSYIDCCQVDIVISESNTELVVEQLITEFIADTQDKIVAYRGDRRWLQTFEPVPLTNNTQENLKLRPGGVYLITGGMGGVGLVLAEHLARTVQAKLILLGRSPLPAREEWEQWLATQEIEDVISQKIKKIQDLEALGAEVLPLTTDICDRESMEQAIALSLKRFGTIDGVIHAAGVAGGGIIQLKTPEIAESVFAPKVTGTLILNEVLAGINLDFLVLCSSLSSIVGGFGQADYCGANAFLDAFARFNHASRHTVAINWDAWQEVGMAVNTDVPVEMKQWQNDNLKNGLLSAEAVKVFERILASELPQVIVSTQNLPAVIEQNNNFLAAYTSPSTNYHSRSSLSKNYVAPRNEIEKTIEKIWQEVIGFERIGIYDNFFELGGHSLLAVQVTSRLREAFQLDLPLQTFLLEAPSIAQLAEVITTKVTSAEDTSEIEDLLAEIESLSPKVLKQELARESSGH
ncbi:SDR family NAD(P)-dependent oxidoreductase [Pleurocapsales cyanobacterium LEGE 06147]|nr:SDR family NAD(P)-dependent oxidoreductase [Pleurocapsales cyanobacterium LEGE 06147]